MYRNFLLVAYSVGPVGFVQDKWKTLVHTAQIAPQQRRGEPVPQELLERVLAAHAYWSQHSSLHCLSSASAVNQTLLSLHCAIRLIPLIRRPCVCERLSHTR